MTEKKAMHAIDMELARIGLDQEILVHVGIQPGTIVIVFGDGLPGIMTTARDFLGKLRTATPGMTTAQIRDLSY